MNGAYLKDLSKLGREISKTIIVDNNPESFLLQAENGIYIKSWFGDKNDNALQELTQILINLTKIKNVDIRQAL
jgi:TFIIF-interacting CTD phosphatase-like protein